MAAFAPPTPMVPPEIRAQGQPPQSAFRQAGEQQPGQGDKGSAADPLGLLEKKIEELEKWAEETMLLVDQVHKPAGALLVPIAQAGSALKQEVQKLRQRSGQRGGAPAAAQPAPNPAEGGMPRAA